MKLVHYLTKKRISVNFIEEIADDGIIEYISSLSDPNILLWYIGTRGLKERAVDVYRERFICPLLRSLRAPIFWLYDLTAWNVFSKVSGNFKKNSKCCELIDSLSSQQIKSVRSSEILQEILVCSNEEIISNMHNVFEMEFVANFQRKYPPTNNIFREVFPVQSRVLQKFIDQDTSWAYAPAQYFEGCFLICHIVNILKREMYDNRCVDIVFLLPNDELKYYGSFNPTIFKNSVEIFCSAYLIDTICEEINISFVSFTYGSCLSQRPYNFPGKVIKKTHISLEKIMGERKSTLSKWREK